MITDNPGEGTTSTPAERIERKSANTDLSHPTKASAPPIHPRGTSSPIPIGAARRIAEEYGYHQVIVIARSVGERGIEHVTTYGIDKANCDVAAHIGNFLKHKIMGWPE